MPNEPAQPSATPAPAAAPAAPATPAPAAAPATPAPAAPAAPASPASAPAAGAVEYSFTVPKDSTLSEADVKAIADQAKQYGLAPDKAQQYLESVDSSRKAYAKAQVDAVADQIQQWTDAVKADPELGGKDGSKLDATVAVADAAMKKFGSDSLKKFLSETGLGSHPDLVRFFYKVGKASANDTVDPKPGSGSSDPRPKTQEERAARMYPSMNQQK